MEVRVEVLGPLRLSVDGVTVDVPGPKRRAVLALLALAEGRIVTVEHLVAALWPAQVPESGRQALHSHVFRLRAHLGAAADLLETTPDGYRLALGPDGLDLSRARMLLARARAGVRENPAAAYTMLREAHGLWRGPVLADLTDVVRVVAAVQECAHLRQEVTDALIGAAVAAGDADAVAGLAAAAHAEDPLREPSVLLLMRALAASGRAPDALRHAREFRHRLAEETGLDPSPALAELERDVAVGSAPTGPPPPARPANRLIGREAQVAALHGLLAAERLVTIVGPGGVGKTRLALEVAHGTAAATVLLLAPVTDPAGIPHALAAALTVTVAHGEVLAACLAVLGDRPGVLVVDNCEHLLDAVRDTVQEVLAACPRLTVLATSREPLGLAAEYAFRLAPLALPGTDRDLARIPSVAVFLERAAKVRPGHPPTPRELRTVADIVRRLDGMPLAIELAAGRLSTFSLDDLHRRLDRSLDLLGGGRTSGDHRHRTLRATVEWSYQLLTDDERRLFRHLSVFADGVDLDTAERLGAELDLDRDPGTVLARLVDASMLEADFTGATRFRMLETLRAFGLDRLAAAGEDATAAARLLRWAVELTAWAAQVMTTDREPDADAVLRRELPNLRTAWRLARSMDTLDDAAAIIVALIDTVSYRDLVEVRGWAEELADDPALTAHPAAAMVLGTAAEAAYHRGDHRRTERLAGAGLKLATDDTARWFCHTPLAVAALARGAYAAAIEHALAAADARASRSHEAFAIAALAAAYAGDLDRARALHGRDAAGAVSPTMLAWNAYVAGEIDNAAGRGAAAEGHYTRAIDLARTSGATFLVGVATVGLLTVRARAGRVNEALEGYREVVGYFARTGNWTHQWATLRNLADLLDRLGDHEPAALLHAAADQAPDAPAGAGPRPGADVPVPSRAAVLDLAHDAITRNLAAA
ncbi:BTAD domain-containing putative transcriptional regulator [Dactylosporangium sp. NPDC049525]|uniref:BTAD domain-containing putative transcriptional regulator n=1 Tax=Dactylosporangium sp. NPDC049525 TaxID=3154730 RepID=UPI00342738A4